jgi:Homeodomain-like domain-containing protein
MVGYTGSEVARLIGKDASTVRRWRRAMQEHGIEFIKKEDTYLFDDYAFRVICNLADNVKGMPNFVLHEEIKRAIQGYVPETPSSEPLPQEKEIEYVNVATLQAMENKWLNHFVEIEEIVYELKEKIEEQNQLLIDHEAAIANLNERDLKFMEAYRRIMAMKKEPKPRVWAKWFGLKVNPN